MLRIEDATIRDNYAIDGCFLLKPAACSKACAILQNREVFFVTPNDLDSDRKSFWRESARY